jgi:hypothetical protein
MGSVFRGLRGNLGLRVGRRLLISQGVLRIVAHVVNLPNFREYGLVQ